MVKLLNPSQSHWRDSTSGFTGFLNWPGDSGRSLLSPPNKKEGFNGHYKQFFSQIAGLWHSLSVADRLDWGVFSENNPTLNRYGDLIVIGGYQWFIRLNTRLLQSNMNPITIPPADSAATYDPSINASQNASNDNLEANIIPSPSSGEAVFWWRSINVPFSQVKPVSTFKTGGYFDNSSPTPFVICESSEIRFVDSRFKFKFQAIDQFGRAASLIYDDLVNVTKAP